MKSDKLVQNDKLQREVEELRSRVALLEELSELRARVVKLESKLGDSVLYKGGTSYPYYTWTQPHCSASAEYWYTDDNYTLTDSSLSANA